MEPLSLFSLQELDGLDVISMSKRRKKSKLGVEESKDKKIMHREIEKQRRQEMASLYASLRSLLPLDYVKGKRSTADHMHETVNYIKHMEDRIQGLKIKRDKLKKEKHNDNAYVGKSTYTSNNNRLRNITISRCQDGVEILISCCVKEKQGFCISKVLMELLKIGLNIVCCISSRANEKVFYKIQAEVRDTTNMKYVCELQERLAGLMETSGSN